LHSPPFYLKFLEAAAAFTEALDYVESHAATSNPSLNKQIVTLINNRSAMYEKAFLPELAIEDCNTILEEHDISHNKARLRKLRILETKYHDYYQALVECCALQLLYMQQNRDQLRLGLPASSPPPIPQSKLEELVHKLVPEQLDEYFNKAQALQKINPRLPADFTVSQLLKSYTGYNSWMAKAAKDGPISKLRKQLESMVKESKDETVIADKASLLMKMGRRYVYDGTYVLARETILKAYDMVYDKPKVQAVMQDDDFARLLEWAGMVKHWTYDLEGATDCYQKCAQLEPNNVSLAIAFEDISDSCIRLLTKAYYLIVLKNPSRKCW
jgi:tetratricopeptide (TPR) repeat protein